MKYIIKNWVMLLLLYFLLLFPSLGKSEGLKNNNNSSRTIDTELNWAIAIANLAARNGDDRPFPAGWPKNLGPNNNSPEIIGKIKIGQTMNEVTKIMGKHGNWHDRPMLSRKEFEKLLKKEAFGEYPCKERIPITINEVLNSLPNEGKFYRWGFQAFPTFNDNILIFFSTPQNDPLGEPKVVCRGIFEWGDY